jgi:hypothetical protein
MVSSERSTHRIFLQVRPRRHPDALPGPSPGSGVSPPRLTRIRPRLRLGLRGLLRGPEQPHRLVLRSTPARVGKPKRVARAGRPPADLAPPGSRPGGLPWPRPRHPARRPSLAAPPPLPGAALRSRRPAAGSAPRPSRVRSPGPGGGRGQDEAPRGARAWTRQAEGVTTGALVCSPSPGALLTPTHPNPAEPAKPPRRPNGPRWPGRGCSPSAASRAGEGAVGSVGPCPRQEPPRWAVGARMPSVLAASSCLPWPHKRSCPARRNAARAARSAR